MENNTKYSNCYGISTKWRFSLYIFLEGTILFGDDMSLTNCISYLDFSTNKHHKPSIVFPIHALVFLRS